MRTPWGDIGVSDAHLHFLSSGFFDVLTKQKGSPVEPELRALGIEAPDSDPAALAERWIEELDRHGVDQAALIASVPGDETSVLSAVRRHPERFHGFFMLNPTEPAAVDRAAAALEAGMRGVCFFPAMHCYPIHDDRVTAVLQLLSGRPGVLAFVHCGMLSVGIRGRLGMASRFDMRFSNPIDLHGVALRFPGVNFLIPHFGAGYLREALMLADLCPNVYFDTSSSNNWVKYHVPPVAVREVFQRMLEVVGAGRLLFGTDSSYFPRGWHRAIFDTQISILTELGISSDDAQLILGANLRRLLTAG
jgi:uncharacterized protein